MECASKLPDSINIDSLGDRRDESGQSFAEVRPLMFLRFLALVVLVTSLSSCAAIRRDRCYLAETRYLGMKAIFEQTGSYQRVAQAMNDEQWATCEINEFRYRLRKDLGLEGEEFRALVTEQEPPREELEFNPGRVEGVPQ